MDNFSIPSRLEDLAETSTSTSFYVENAWDPAEYGDHSIEERIDEVSNLPFVDDCLCLSQSAIDTLYSLAVGFTTLSPAMRASFLDALMQLSSRVLALAVDSNGSLAPQAKNNTKAVLYFLSAAAAKVEALVKSEESPVSAAEGKVAKGKGKGKGKAAKGSDAEDDMDGLSDGDDDFGPKKGKGKGKAASKAKATKGKSSGGFNWPEYRAPLLELILKSAEMEPSALWSMGLVHENFLSANWGYALSLLEAKPVGLAGHGSAETRAKALCVGIIVRSVESFSGASSGSLASLSTAVLDAIMRSEHMCNAAAEICSKSNAVLAAEVLGEVARLNMAGLQSTGVKNVGAFVEALAKVNPQLMTSQLPVVMKQLDSGAHQIRSSLLHAMGLVIVHIHSVCVKDAAAAAAALAAGGSSTEAADAAKAAAVEAKAKKDGNDSDDEEGEDKAKSDSETDFRKNTALLPNVRNALLDMLVERTHDTSHYSRAAVLKVWQELLEAEAVPTSRVGSIAEIAVDRLQDKTAAVRKAAMALLTTVIDLNPFSGNLDAAGFQQEKTNVELAITMRLRELREMFTPVEPEDDDKELAAAAAAEAEAAASAAKKDSKKAKAAKGKGKSSKVLSAVLEDEEEESDDEGDDKATPETADAATKDKAEVVKAAKVDENDPDDPFLQTADVVEDADLNALKFRLGYCKSALELITAISVGITRMSDMIRSKTSSDVIEAVRFLSRAANFGIAGSISAFQASFSLVFHSDANVKAETLLAFKNVLMLDGSENTPSALPPAEVAVNLLTICKRCDAAAVTSMEEIIGCLFEEKSVDAQIIQALWAKATASSNADADPSVNETGAALRVLSIIAQHSKDVMTPARVRCVRQVGYSTQVFASRDFATLRAAAQCLQATPSLHAGMPVTAETNEYKTELLACTQGLVSVIAAQGLCGPTGDDETSTREWFSACEESVNALFHIHPCPDKVLASIITPLHASLATPPTPETTSERVHCSAARLSRLLFVLGQTALGSLVYAERISILAKKAAAAAGYSKAETKAETKAAEIVDKPKGKKGKAASAAATAADAASAANAATEGEDALEDEMGLAAAADADSERVFIMLTERELVLSNLLGKFHPIVAFVVANQKGSFSSPLLRETSLLALCRFMSVSSILCEQYLPLLFTVLETETSEACRTTLMIALGDLSFRFPNALEPWTPLMYARLGDDRVLVRYNALMVLTHLILNDMIKVKGQVTHVVMCLSDPEERVRDLAALFFSKLSERSNNPIYNLLGDIIGTLSGASTVSTTTDDAAGVAVAVAAVDSASIPKRSLSPAEFQKTMTFLLTFVKKDKQADGMLERLLTRLSMAQTLRQRRCLAFCVSELHITDKGVKRMAECIRGYKEALYDEQTFEFILDAVHKAKKNSRAVGASVSAEGKTAIDEFEALLEAIRRDAKGEEVSAQIDRAQQAAGLVTEDDANANGTAAADEEDFNLAPKAGAKGKKTLGKKADDKAKPKAKPAARGKAKGKKRADSDDDDDENDSEEEEEARPAASARGGAKKPAASSRSKAASAAEPVKVSSTRPSRAVKGRVALADVTNEDEAEMEF